MKGRAVDVSAARTADADMTDQDWLAVTASGAGLTFSVGVLLLYLFGIFMRPLSAEFGWSRTGLPGAVATSQYALALSAPAWGWLMDRYGPRAIMLPSVAMLPATFIATRGAAAPVRSRTASQSAAVSKAIRTLPFVLMCAAFILLGIVSIGVLAHLVPMMIDRGFTPATAAQLAAATGLATVVARGGLGWLLDRYHARYLLAAMALLAAVSFLLLACISGTASSAAAAVLLGVVVGAEVDFISFLVRRYFDQSLFGRVYGLAFGLYLLGVGTGPLVLAASFDHLGGYTPGLVGFAVITAVIIGLAIALPEYGSPVLAGPQRGKVRRVSEAGPETAELRMQPKGLSRNNRVSIVGRLGFRAVLSWRGD